MAESLAATAAVRPGVFIVFREDLADEHHTDQSLTRDFGAEPGDEIIEIRAANLAVSRRLLAAPLAA